MFHYERSPDWWDWSLKSFLSPLTSYFKPSYYQYFPIWSTWDFTSDFPFKYHFFPSTITQHPLIRWTKSVTKPPFACEVVGWLAESLSEPTRDSLFASLWKWKAIGIFANEKSSTKSPCENEIYGFEVPPWNSRNKGARLALDGCGFIEETFRYQSWNLTSKWNSSHWVKIIKSWCA